MKTEYKKRIEELERKFKILHRQGLGMQIKGMKEGAELKLKEVREKIERFKSKINKFGFTTNHQDTLLIREQVLEILEEELKKELEELK